MMENFNEKFKDLKEYINHSGQFDLMECVDYIEKVILPHCMRMEKALDLLNDNLLEISGEFEMDLDLFNLGKMKPTGPETVIL